MKQVIIALTTAAVFCVAGASFAQKPKPAATEAAKTEKVVIIVQAPEAVSKAEERKPRVVTINGEAFKIKPGSREVTEKTRRMATKNVTVMYGEKTCRIKLLGVPSNGKLDGFGVERVAVVLSSKKVNGLEEVTSCNALVHVAPLKA